MRDLMDKYTDIASMARAMRERELSAEELSAWCLERIQALNPILKAFRLVCPEAALEQARAAQGLLSAGRDLGPLQGIPLAVKDLLDVAGMPTCAGFGLLGQRAASRDAAVVRRLSQAGMVFVGKTHTVQFAYGGVGINHDQGTPHNPWSTEHMVPGGSSSGSAVAVASGMVPAALGTDTGGSVRIPASLCGITGLKTTVGRVSRAGVYPLSWTLDSVGPLARSVEDVALLYQAMAGEHPQDQSTWGQPAIGPLTGLTAGVRGMRLALPAQAFWEDVDPEVELAVRGCADVLRGLGALVEEMDFPVALEACTLAKRGLIISAEAYCANRQWVDEHFHELDPIVAFRIVKGKEVPAYRYIEALREMQALRIRAMDELKGVDGLLVPTTRVPALPVTQVDSSVESYALANWSYLRNTSIGNILNLCALSVPCGFTSRGLPMGLMIYGKPFEEEKMLRIGYAFQKATNWHLARPDLSFALAKAEGNP